MGEKSLLISSMQKLIKYPLIYHSHIRKSQSNQEQIFYSLSRTDFKKILSNLEDDNPLLRKTSLNLIAELLACNSKLKKKFCYTMEINLLSGKVLFNSKAIEKHVNSGSFRQLLTLLKKQPDQIQSNCLLWYINTKSRQFEVQFIQKDRSKINPQIDIDPQQCIVGFCLSPADLSSQYSATSISITTVSEIPEEKKRFGLKNLIEPSPKKLVPTLGLKTNHSTQSDSQPRYQRNTKPETDRPKKFINNFLQQRKMNTSKGPETQRYNTLSSELISKQMTRNIPTQQSYEMSKEIVTRSTMPKTTQSPYIPTLNLQNSMNSQSGYRPDKISQSKYMAVSSSNRTSKDMDFQKVKYQQGIKLTSNNVITPRSSYGNNIPRSNTDRDHPGSYLSSSNGFVTNNGSYISNSNAINQQAGQKREAQNSFNFKYIKPMTTANQQGLKYVNFFHKKHEEYQPPISEKKTIDVFQFIKNK